MNDVITNQDIKQVILISKISAEELYASEDSKNTIKASIFYLTNFTLYLFFTLICCKHIYLLGIFSQINGNNGSFTNTDDHAEKMCQYRNCNYFNLMATRFCCSSCKQRENKMVMNGAKPFQHVYEKFYSKCYFCDDLKPDHLGRDCPLGPKRLMDVRIKEESKKEFSIEPKQEEKFDIQPNEYSTLMKVLSLEADQYSISMALKQEKFEDRVRKYYENNEITTLQYVQILTRGKKYLEGGFNPYGNGQTEKKTQGDDTYEKKDGNQTTNLDLINSFRTFLHEAINMLDSKTGSPYKECAVCGVNEYTLDTICSADCFVMFLGKTINADFRIRKESKICGEIFFLLSEVSLDPDYVIIKVRNKRILIVVDEENVFADTKIYTLSKIGEKRWVLIETKGYKGKDDVTENNVSIKAFSQGVLTDQGGAFPQAQRAITFSGVGVDLLLESFSVTVSIGRTSGYYIGVILGGLYDIAWWVNLNNNSVVIPAQVNPLIINYGSNPTNCIMSGRTFYEMNNSELTDKHTWEGHIYDGQQVYNTSQTLYLNWSIINFLPYTSNPADSFRIYFDIHMKCRKVPQFESTLDVHFTGVSDVNIVDVSCPDQSVPMIINSNSGLWVKDLTSCGDVEPNPGPRQYAGRSSGTNVSNSEAMSTDYSTYISNKYAKENSNQSEVKVETNSKIEQTTETDRLYQLMGPEFNIYSLLWHSPIIISNTIEEDIETGTKWIDLKNFQDRNNKNNKNRNQNMNKSGNGTNSQGDSDKIIRNNSGKGTGIIKDGVNNMSKEEFEKTCEDAKKRTEETAFMVERLVVTLNTEKKFVSYYAKRMLFSKLPCSKKVMCSIAEKVGLTMSLKISYISETNCDFILGALAIFIEKSIDEERSSWIALREKVLLNNPEAARFYIKGWTDDLTMDGDVELNPGPQFDEEGNIIEGDIIATMNKNSEDPLHMNKEVENTEKVDKFSSAIDIFNSRSDIERFILNNIKEALILDSITRTEADNFIRNAMTTPTFLDKLVTTGANIGINQGWTSYLGPSYTGDSFAPIHSVRELAERLSVEPKSELDAIARVHDLLYWLSLNDKDRFHADEMMINAIDNIKEPSNQAKLAKAALETQFKTNSYKPVDKSILSDSVSVNINTNQLQSEKNKDNQGLTNRDRMTNENSGLTRRDRLMKQYSKNNNFIKKDLTKEGIEPNPGPFSLDKLVKEILEYLKDYKLTGETDILTLLGFNPSQVASTNRTFDNTQWMRYIMFRSAQTSMSLLYFKLTVDTPIDVYTGHPTDFASGGAIIVLGATVYGTTRFVPVGGVGPSLVSGTIAKPWEDIEASQSSTISAVRTQNPILQNTTNLVAWSNSKDVAAELGKDSFSVGSNAGMYAKMLLLRDQLDASTDICPLWNKIDGSYVKPLTTPVPGAPLPLFPQQTGVITINYWACLQTEFAAYQWRFQTTVAAFGDPIWCFVKASVLSNGVAGDRDQIIMWNLSQVLPSPIVEIPKSCYVFADAANNNNVRFFSRVQQTADIKDPFFVGPNRVYNVIFVLIDWSATVQGQAFGYNYNFNFGGLLIDSINNNPFNVAGIPVPDAGTLELTIRNSLSVRTGGSFAVAADDWYEMYGTDTEVERALFELALRKCMFTQSAAARTTGDLITGKNVESAISARNVVGTDRLITNPNTAASFRNIMQFQDMCGRYLTNEFPYAYTKSTMSDKIRFAMAIRVRVPELGTKTRRFLRRLDSLPFSVHIIELASSIRQSFDAYILEASLSNKMLNGTIEGLAVGSTDIVKICDSFLMWIQHSMGIGDYITRRSIPIPDRTNPLLPADTGIDTYACLPGILDESMAISPWYSQPEQKSDVRDVSSFVTPKDMSVVTGTIFNNGLVIGIASVNVVDSLIDIKKFSEIWTPNIITSRIYLDPDNIVAFDARIYQYNPNTQNLFPIYNTFIMPSGREYFKPLNEVLPGINYPYASLRKAFIGYTKQIAYTADTQRPNFKIAVSASMAMYLVNPAVRAFSTYEETAISVRANPTSTIDLNRSTVISVLNKMKLTTKEEATSEIDNETKK